MIVTEKGLLKQEDFDHVQKIIEVYSKALLFEMWKEHAEQRLKLYQDQNWTNYV